MSVLIAGSIALDNLRTPFGTRNYVLGGSAIHSAVAASFFNDVELLGVVGEDFPKKHIDFLKSRKINTDGLKVLPGKTFHWEGYYEYDMNVAHTLRTDLNVLANFDPVLTDKQKKCPYVFLANLDPDIQLKIVSQLEKPKLVVADTMNYWIENKRRSLENLLSKIDILVINDMEARELSKEPNLIKASKIILGYGCKNVIIKKGEHGALLFSNEFSFSTPSHPQMELIDPTGAGDSFAGSFIGYLSAVGKIDWENLKKAVIIGCVIASFNVEDFSIERLKTLTKEEILSRYSSMRENISFGDIEENLIRGG